MSARKLRPYERANRIIQETSGVRGLSGISSNDATFLEGLRTRTPSSLSPKQEKWLSDIERRVFGGDK